MLTYFISLMTFCFLIKVTWAGDQFTLSKTLVPLDTKPFAAFIRKNPKVFVIEIPDSGGDWRRLSLASATTPATNFVFLSVWASAGQSHGSIGIRLPGDTIPPIYPWYRNVGNIYQNGLIYMDVTDPSPLCLLLCPTNESQEIEYRYLLPQQDGQFQITVLGYLEGEWRD